MVKYYIDQGQTTNNKHTHVHTDTQKIEDHITFLSTFFPQFKQQQNGYIRYRFYYKTTSTHVLQLVNIYQYEYKL